MVAQARMLINGVAVGYLPGAFLTVVDDTMVGDRSMQFRMSPIGHRVLL
jgi:hypothetical protein